jgi:hypothetical protein
VLLGTGLASFGLIDYRRRHTSECRGLGQDLHEGYAEDLLCESPLISVFSTRYWAKTGAEEKAGSGSCILCAVVILELK